MKITVGILLFGVHNDLYGVVLYYIIVILDYTQVSILLVRGIIDTDLVEGCS
jgi:hypothetical protein